MILITNDQCRRLYKDHNAVPNDTIPSSLLLIRNQVQRRENERLAEQALRIANDLAIAATTAADRDPVNNPRGSQNHANRVAVNDGEYFMYFIVLELTL
jgi:hypothetical protein